MNILLLEDNQHRITFFKNGLKAHKLTICNHAKAAKKALKKQSFDIIFLDHDLRNEPIDPESDNCGTEIARYIVDHYIECDCIILHTENPIGRDAMEILLVNSQSIPYSKLKKIGFHNLLKSLTQDDV